MNIESQIDLRKHVMYSPLMEKIIKEHLLSSHGNDSRTPDQKIYLR